jgi:hypothetical protein
VANQLKVSGWLLKLKIQNAVLHIEQDIIVLTQDHVGKLIIGLVKNGNMIKLIDILKEINLDEKWWAISVDTPEDWEILSQFLDSKGYTFEPGYTFSGNDLTTFNPFKDEKYFDSHEYDADSDDKGYAAAMSYEGTDEFILLSRPKNKLNMVNSNTFIPRKDSTYKRYKYFTNLTDLIRYINS